MIRNITCQERIRLGFTIDNALREATQEVFIIVKTKKLQEPDYIAALTLRFIKKIYDILNNFFNGYYFSTTGIFCHQKPLANFIGKTGSCEIGDLLFIYIFSDIQGKKSYNSLLLQAKISDSEKLKLHGKSELSQLNLYFEWPEFYYSRAGKLNGNKRDITPKVFTSGAKYLLIDPTVDICKQCNPFEYIYGTALAHNPLILDNQLSLELIDFINFKAGRRIEERPDGTGDDLWTKDEWSKLIWDMIDITKDSYARRKNIGIDKFDRTTVAGNFLFYTQNNNNRVDLTLFDGIDNNNTVPYDYSNEEPSGLSMVIIESKESE
jgi:hypothetical protein